MNSTTLKSYAPLALRLGIGFVFIWFGYSGLANPEMWTALVPAWTSAIATAQTLVYIHAAIELIGGLLICAGFWLRPVAAILFLNLVHTITLLAYGPIMVRDIGLAMALLAIFLEGDSE